MPVRRTPLVRAALVGLLAALLAPLLTAGPAVAESGGVISGTVTREDGGAPLPNVGVYVMNVTGGFSYNGHTDSSGDYAVAELPPGQYTVRFDPTAADPALVPEYWDDADWVSAQRITVGSGEVVSDVDAALAAGGTITGTVTRENDGAPVAGVIIGASEAGAGNVPGSVVTDAQGEYRLERLHPGDYLIQFSAPSGEQLAGEYWDDAATPLKASAVSVAAGQTRGGIDAELSAYATVSGRVTAADGSPVGATVTFSNAEGTFWQSPADETGSYQATVPKGTYTVTFDARDQGFAIEYWRDAAVESEATPLTVAPGQSLSAVDAVLGDSVQTSIIGTVLENGEALSEAVVEVFADGEFAGMSYTDATGRYEIALPPGTYTVRAWGETYNPIYARQYYDAANTPSEATAVELGAEGPRTGVDFDLELGGDIRGVVTAEGGLPEGGVDVVAYLWSGGRWREAATVTTDGAYLFGSELSPGGGPLPAGEYRIGVRAPGHCEQFFGGFSLADATTLAVDRREILTSIDVTLADECPEQVNPTLSLAASSVKAGADLAVTGAGFVPGEVVTFELHSEPIALGTLVADRDGDLSGALRIPAAAEAGAHTLVALDEESNVLARAAVTVTASSGSTDGNGGGSTGTGGTAGGGVTIRGGLAVTGGEAPVAIAVVAVIVIAAGGLLMLRRRRSRD